MTTPEDPVAGLEARLDAAPDREAAATVDAAVAATPEQSAWAGGARAARRLLQDDDAVEVFHAMIAMRRIYAVAYRELAGMVDAAALDPMTLDVLVGAAMHEAAQPFDERELMQKVVNAVMPWLARTVDKHLDADRDAARAEAREREEERRSRAIPLGFDYDLVPAELRGLDPPPGELGRDRGLVLVGWGPALGWLADRITAAAAAAGLNTLRLARAARPEDASARLVRFALNDWEGCCNSKRALGEARVKWDRAATIGRTDLIVCDDLTKAYTKSYTGRPLGAVAGDAHRRFDQLCKVEGAAFVGLIPLSDPELRDTTGPEFEQLRTFAHLRQVACDVVDDGAAYLVRVGRLQERVDAATLRRSTVSPVIQR